MVNETVNQTDDCNDIPASYLSRMADLAYRLLRVTLLVGALALMLMFAVNDLLKYWLMLFAKHFQDNGLVYTTDVIIAPFYARFKIAAAAAVFIALPYILWQAWSFIAPGLYRQQKSFVIRLVGLGLLLFYLGVYYVYAVDIPAVIQLFMSYLPEGVEYSPDLLGYVNYSLEKFFTFGFGLVLPVAIWLYIKEQNVLKNTEYKHGG